jgi:4-hydroxy-2-oxovalerate/4-hydroxy-2-oxohexanoate aldolase
MNLQGKTVRLHDMSLRDGMHAKRHQISLEQMVDVATGLDEAGMPLIEVTHIGLAAKMEMDCVGFLMMAHMASPEKVLEQARLMVGYGANCVYCTDSAGYMLPDEVSEKIGLLRSELPANIEVGFHGHHNLGLGIANSLAAIDAGASRIDGSVAGLGAGAGNTPLEVLCAVLDRLGANTGIDLYRIMDVAEDRVVPLMDQPIRVDRDALTLGYAGVYSSFLLFAKRAEKKYGVSARDILVELGRRGTVGGQEDRIEDLALTLANEKGLA